MVTVEHGIPSGGRAEEQLGRPAVRGAFHGIVAAGGLTLGFTAPLTAVFAVQLGASPFAAGLSVASLTMVVLVLDVVGTRALPYLEPRRSITVGMVVWGIGSFASALAPDFWTMELARLLQGLGLALFSAAGPQLAVRLAGPDRVGAALGEFQAAMTLGSIFAPLAGGLIVALSPGVLGSRLAFAACGVCALVCAVAARRLLPRVPSPVRPRLSLPSLPGFTRPRAATALVSAAAGQGVRSALVLTVIPLVATQGVGLTTAAVGVFLTVTYGVESLTGRRAGSVSDRNGRRPVTIVGAVAGLLGVTVLLAALGVRDPVVLCAATIPLGIAGGCLLGILPATVVDLAPRPEVGIAGMRLSRDLGFTVCPVVAGALISTSGPEAALAFCAGMFAVVAVACVAVGETLPRERAPA